MPRELQDCDHEYEPYVCSCGEVEDIICKHCQGTETAHRLDVYRSDWFELQALIVSLGKHVGVGDLAGVEVIERKIVEALEGSVGLRAAVRDHVRAMTVYVNGPNEATWEAVTHSFVAMATTLGECVTPEQCAERDEGGTA